MKVNYQFNTNSYRPSNPFKAANTWKQANRMPEVNGEHISLKKMLQDAAKEQRAQSTFANNSILASSMSYSEKLKAQRENMRNASLEKKKLKYQFKDISSQIMRSKTSLSARKAVGAARRELLRLKQEKRSGKYDEQEIEAAINHAKAMERVAKKKVKHLEEEEMLRAAGGLCGETLVEEDEKLRDEDVLSEEELEELQEEELLQEESEDIEDLSIEDMEAMMADMEAMMDEMSQLTSEMMDEMDEGMRDMLEEMGFGEISDSLTAAKGEIDPQDYKMMKIKHRCKEMKEIVKADSDYLKAVFEQLEKMKGGGMGIPMGHSGAVAMGGSSPVPVPVSTGGAEVAQAPVIDISL